MSHSAFLDIVTSALLVPSTVDAWPADAPELFQDGARDTIELLQKMRGNGGVSFPKLILALEERKRFADAAALKEIDLAAAEALTKTGVLGAFKTVRAGQTVAEGENNEPRKIHSARAEDIRNAQRLVELGRGSFIYSHGGPYYHWDGRRWERDDAAAIYELAAKVALSWWKDAQEATSRQTQDEFVKHARISQKAARIEAMVSLAARALPDLKINTAELNADPWLLNVQNGTLDLRTGKLRRHDQRDLITKLAGTHFDLEAKAPRWEQFLAEVLPSPELRAYVQRAAGLSLTGVVTEHCFFMAVGAGRNGKGVLLRCLARAMGDYARTAPMDLLVNKPGNDHPAELVVLEGARLVIVSELPPKGRWNEARLKQLTGGDTVSARGMRENWREMQPTWHIWIATNERPHAIGEGHALWERLKEIRFPTNFRDEGDSRPEVQQQPVRDPGLEDALAAEVPGILRWAVDGCLAWQRAGLGEPPEVRTATAEYRASEDPLRPFLAEHPVTQPVKLGDLFAAWVEYAKRANERPGKQRDFSAALRSRGYPVKPGHAGYAFVYPIELTLNFPVISSEASREGQSDGEVVRYRIAIPETTPIARAQDPDIRETRHPYLTTSPTPTVNDGAPRWREEPGCDDGDEEAT